MQPGDPMLAERVWETVVKSFATQMKSAFTASSFVKDPFVVGYPKLLGMVDGLLERLFRDTNVKGVPPAIKPEARDQLVAALEPFQTAYLGKSLGRLSELVNSMFPSAVRGSIPSQEQVFRLVSRIQEELDIVKSDVKLTFLVLQEIGEILRLLAEKAEYQVILSSNLYTIFCLLVESIFRWKRESKSGHWWSVHETTHLFIPTR